MRVDFILKSNIPLEIRESQEKYGRSSRACSALTNRETSFATPKDSKWCPTRIQYRYKEDLEEEIKIR